MIAMRTTRALTVPVTSKPGGHLGPGYINNVVKEKKKNNTRFVPLEVPEEQIYYEGDKIIDYVDLFDKISFD